jgi:methionyl aminopeptidase
MMKNKILFNLFSKKFCLLNRKEFFKPFDLNQIKTVTPARFVPPHILRPKYVTQPNYEPGYKELSVIRGPEDLKKFRKACSVAAGAVQRAMEIVKEGVTTDDIDEVVHNYIVSQDAYPSAIGYMGFPKSVCTSINESNILII